MPILSLLWSNRYLIALALALFAGWQAHTIYDGYKAEKTSRKVIKALGKGQADIINFNQEFNKVRDNVKDDCIDRPMPAPVIELLR